MGEPEEFRCVHAAREALAQYIASGRNLSIIRGKRVSNFGVWQCVFEKERKAYRELQIKEWHDTILSWEDCSQKMKAMFIVCFLSKLQEFDSPLSLKDAIKVVLDGFGAECLPLLQAEAKVHYERRVEIVKPYHRPDDEWVNQSKKLMEALS